MNLVNWSQVVRGQLATLGLRPCSSLSLSFSLSLSLPLSLSLSFSLPLSFFLPLSLPLSLSLSLSPLSLLLLPQLQTEFPIKMSTGCAHPFAGVHRDAASHCLCWVCLTNALRSLLPFLTSLELIFVCRGNPGQNIHCSVSTAPSTSASDAMNAVKSSVLTVFIRQTRVTCFESPLRLMLRCALLHNGAVREHCARRT